MVAGCQQDFQDIDSIFYNGDGRQVHCGINLDERGGNSDFSVESALDRAADRGEVVELYAHKPGVTVRIDRLESVIVGAHDRGLRFYTYADFAAGVPVEPGIALSFDDSDAAGWSSLRPLFQAYGARITFFISRWPTMGDEDHERVRVLRADGHDIAAHSIEHLRAPDFVEEHGLRAYLDEEALPSISLLEDEGFPVTSFAYPFGARTGELDEALLRRVPIVRGIEFAYAGIGSPCPN